MKKLGFQNYSCFKSYFLLFFVKFAIIFLEFICMNFDSVLKEGLTFDDVLLIPAYSKILPGQASTGTFFSKNITLSIPIISAAMDTISESQMAISLAREGGISVIHKNMSIQNQAKEINIVKRSESFAFFLLIIILCLSNTFI